MLLCELSLLSPLEIYGRRTLLPLSHKSISEVGPLMLGDKARPRVSTNFCLMRPRSGLCAARLSSSTTAWSDCFFMALALCSCRKRKGSSPNSCHNAGRTLVYVSVKQFVRDFLSHLISFGVYFLLPADCWKEGSMVDREKRRGEKLSCRVCVCVYIQYNFRI